MADIAYSSCDCLSSALCMDKIATKVFLNNAQILTPKYVHFDKCTYEINRQNVQQEIKEKLSFPCIVKPANLGSSVGINICENEHQLNCTIENALQFDNKIIIEQFIDNAREFCCAIITNAGKLVASKVCEVKKGKFFTFEEKYLSQKEDEKREITKLLEREIKDMAISTYKALQCFGVVRIDFLYDGKNLYVNELNSIPGSLSFSMFNTSHSDILNTLVNESIKRKNSRAEIVYKFNSQAIEKFVEMKNKIKKK